MNWFKSTLANVAGTQEPIYGPEAILSVASQAQQTPYTELTKEHMQWRAYRSTCVETQTFYLMGDNGTLALVQAIYSNVGGIHTTAQFNAKIFSSPDASTHSWYSDPLHNYKWDEPKYSFSADNFSLTLNDEGSAYRIQSSVNKSCVVDLIFSRTAPGFLVGKDGTSYFGTDPAKPWGSMRHAFWPRCAVEGTIITKTGALDLKGRGLFIHALQGMKPHHAAVRWDFLNFQGPTYSAIMMEYTTPPSYGSTVVNVGGIVTDDEIVCAGAANSAAHMETTPDEESGWPEPTAVKFDWNGETKDGKPVNATIEGSLGQKLDRVDVMAEVPGFIKSIAGTVAGTRPYIFQFSPQNKLSLNMKLGDEKVVEEGSLFCEATFIS